MRHSIFLITLFLFLLIVLTTPSFALERKNATPASRMKISEAMQNKKEALKQRLATFKDTVKAERVDRINTILGSVNTNRTTTMQANLEKMTAIVVRLETKLTELESEGKDTSAAKLTTASAKTAIETAKTALTAQAAKDYTIAITSESTVKTDAATMRQSLHTDLRTLHQLVVDARQAVAKAISETKSLLGKVEDGE